MFGNSVSNKNFSFLDGRQGRPPRALAPRERPEKLEQYQRITTWHIEQCAYLLDRMNADPRRRGDAPGQLDGPVRLGTPRRQRATTPTTCRSSWPAGPAARLAPGRHLVYGKDTPLCNLYVSMLDRVGAPVERFADSTGPLEGLDNPKYVGTLDGLIAAPRLIRGLSRSE